MLSGTESWRLHGGEEPGGGCGSGGAGWRAVLDWSEGRLFDPLLLLSTCWSVKPQSAPSGSSIGLHECVWVSRGLLNSSFCRQWTSEGRPVVYDQTVRLVVLVLWLWSCRFHFQSVNFSLIKVFMQTSVCCRRPCFPRADLDCYGCINFCLAATKKKKTNCIKSCNKIRENKRRDWQRHTSSSILRFCSRTSASGV